ncbi:MAG: hypothetical protein JXM79_18340 [Sedimentisphaerales bacterium]|nr:hypothetical protein [Sedimentisphaerales bacterium]
MTACTTSINREKAISDFSKIKVRGNEEFKSIVGPMIEKEPEDILHGAYAVFTAWGWAKSEIVESISGEKMVVRTYDYYESDVKDTFRPTRGFAYMIKGVCRAFMEIAYDDNPYPDGFGKFKCEQTKGIELGDDYGEFVLTEA